MIDACAQAKIAELTAIGFAGTLFLTTDDVMKDYETRSAHGVEFTEKPTPQPYGIDCGFRDPSGNSIRLVERPPRVVAWASLRGVAWCGMCGTCGRFRGGPRSRGEARRTSAR